MYVKGIKGGGPVPMRTEVGFWSLNHIVMCKIGIFLTHTMGMLLCDIGMFGWNLHCFFATFAHSS